MGRKRTGSRKHVHFCIAGLILLFLSNCATLHDIKVRREACDYLKSGRKLLTQGDFQAALEAMEKVLSLSPHRPPEDEALFNIGLLHAHFGNAKKDYTKSVEAFHQLMRHYPKSPLAEQAEIWANVLQENEKLKDSFDSSQQDAERLRQALDNFEKSRRVEVKGEESSEIGEALERSQRLLSQGDFGGSSAAAQKVLSLSPRRPPEDEALFTLGLIHAHPGNSKKDYQKSIDSFRKLVKEHPKSFWSEQAKIWIGVLQENEKLKEVIQKSKDIDLEIDEKKRGKAK
jgi:tetratricopeptide (TPR) repeat protein